MPKLVVSPNRFVWQPLFEGQEARAIDALVQAIIDRLRDPDLVWRSDPGLAADATARQRLHAASLAGGWAGVALLHGYRYLSGGSASDRAAMQTLLDHAIDVIADTPSPPELSGGFLGVAWAMQHLRHAAAIPCEADPLGSADEAVELLLSTRGVPMSYDLINGVVGCCVYCLERLPMPRASACLQRAIDRLESAAVRTMGGTAWRTPPEALAPRQRALAPAGYYNTGMAHGIAGVLAALGAAYAAGLHHEGIPSLIESSAKWLLGQQLRLPMSSQFPNWVLPGGEPGPSRFAWCYGDPGVAIGLYGAARGVGDQRLAEQALELARQAAGSSPGRVDVVDASLCHGTAGIGHIFNRLYQSTRDDCFADAARFWFRRTLSMRAQILGADQCAAHEGQLVAEDAGGVDASFLTGAAGTALALMASVTSVDPQWDRILLTTLPPAANPPIDASVTPRSGHSVPPST